MTVSCQTAELVQTTKYDTMGPLIKTECVQRISPPNIHREDSSGRLESLWGRVAGETAMLEQGIPMTGNGNRTSRNESFHDKMIGPPTSAVTSIWPMTA